ncbi:MAG: PAS domain S-box protein [Armatimonadota bacterium]
MSAVNADSASRADILVVDDTPDELRLLADILSGAGYRVRTATDGRLALRSVQAELPELILLDIRMPGLDGYEVARQLKADARTHSVPIIFISTLESEREKIKAFQAGGVDYINKPFHAEEVLARINVHLSLRRAQLDLERSNAELMAARETLEDKVRERTSELQVSGERFRALVEQTPLSIQILSPDGRTIYVNPAFMRLWGVSPETLQILKSSYNMLEDEELKAKGIMPYIRRGFAGEAGEIPIVKYEIETLDEMLRVKTGMKTAWVRGYIFPIKDAAGKIREVVVTHEDFGPRVKAEQELRASEERLARIIETTPNGITIVDREGNITFANAAAERILGLSRSEIAGRTYNAPAWRITTAEGAPFPQEELLFAQVTRTGSAVYGIEHAIEHPDGTRRILSINAAPLRDADGHLAGMVASLTDISERKQAEQALQKVNRTLRMLSCANQALVRAESEPSLLEAVCGCIMEVGGYRMAWIGYAEDDPGKTVRPVVHAGDEAGYLDAVKISWADNELGRGPTGIAIRTGKPVFACDITGDTAYTPWRAEALKRGYMSSIAVPLIADGRTFGSLNLYAGQPNAFDDEEVALLVELANDLAYGVISLRAREERRRAQEELAESEKKYRTLIEVAPVGFVVHREGKIIFANGASAEIMHAAGPQGLVGKELMDFVHSDYRAIVMERIRQMVQERKLTPLIEEKFVRSDGTIVDVEVAAMPITFEGSPAILVAMHDITERKEAEERERELEAHKREFYRRTIIAATEGKLVIAERDEIERIAGPAIATWEIKRKEDVAALRNAVAEIARSAGMEEPRVFDFTLAIGEAATNAFKHAGGGTASLHRVADSLLLVVSDRGPGIEALALPEVALRRGYTTAASLGMGYKAIIAVSDTVYLATGPQGTTVGIKMGLHPPEFSSGIAALPDAWRS